MYCNYCCEEPNIIHTVFDMYVYMNQSRNDEEEKHEIFVETYTDSYMT